MTKRGKSVHFSLPHNVRPSSAWKSQMRRKGGKMLNNQLWESLDIYNWLHWVTLLLDHIKHVLIYRYVYFFFCLQVTEQQARLDQADVLLSTLHEEHDGKKNKNVQAYIRDCSLNIWCLLLNNKQQWNVLAPCSSSSRSKFNRTSSLMLQSSPRAYTLS